MTNLPDWIMAFCAIGSLVIAIVALRKADEAITQVKNLTNSSSSKGKVGSQRVKGNDNTTVTGTGNNIS